jgi:disease resistance protein RPM1
MFEPDKLISSPLQAQEQRMRFQQTDDVASRKTNTTIDIRLLAMHAGASGLVGIDGPIYELIQLMSGGVQFKVLSIVGLGGLGKTTLANEIYRKLHGQFQCRAFVSVSRKPNIRKLLSTMTSQVGLVANKNIEEFELISWLRKRLQKQRYASLEIILFIVWFLVFYFILY